MNANGFEFTVQVEVDDDVVAISGFSSYREALGLFKRSLASKQSAQLYDFEGRCVFCSLTLPTWSDPLVDLPAPGRYLLEFDSRSGTTRFIPVAESQAS